MLENKVRGFEIAKGWEDKDIHLPIRKTKHSAGYDVEAAEDVVIPAFSNGQKPVLIPTGLKAYCQEDEFYMLVNRSSGPKKGLVMCNSIGIIDADYYDQLLADQTNPLLMQIITKMKQMMDISIFNIIMFWIMILKLKREMSLGKLYSKNI